jgi:predicted short-subunit dehydrogenase-like oxidoreductase (DUF2520 family)
MKSVSIIGSGNVAEYLATSFFHHEVLVKEICSRNYKTGNDLAEAVQANFITEVSMLSDEVDFIIIAVSDSQISVLVDDLKKKKCIVAHTAGSVEMNILSGNAYHGVFYPLQTFTKNIKPTYKDFPFYIEASDEDTNQKLKQLAEKISPNVFEASSNERKSLHLAAVFANNFVNHLLSISKEIVERDNLNFSHLVPLIHETVYKAHLLSPDQAQTGPARRGDTQSIIKHQRTLTQTFPQHIEVYNTLTQSILKKYKS